MLVVAAAAAAAARGGGGAKARRQLNFKFLHAPEFDDARFVTVELDVPEQLRASGAPLCVVAATAGGAVAKLTPFTLTICTLGPSQLSMVPHDPQPVCSKCGKTLVQPFASFNGGAVLACQGACADQVQGNAPGTANAAAVKVQKVARGKEARKKVAKKRKKKK